MIFYIYVKFHQNILKQFSNYCTKPKLLFTMIKEIKIIKIIPDAIWLSS